MGNAGPIAIPPAEKIDFATDGTISIKPLGQAATELAVIDRIRLVNPSIDQLDKGEDGLMRLKDGRPAEVSADVQLVSGYLEGSNVNLVDQMVDMIELARRFELQVKMMKTAEETDAASTSLLRQQG